MTLSPVSTTQTVPAIQYSSSGQLEHGNPLQEIRTTLNTCATIGGAVRASLNEVERRVGQLDQTTQEVRGDQRFLESELDQRAREMQEIREQLNRQDESLARQGRELDEIVEHSAMQNRVLDSVEEGMAMARGILDRTSGSSSGQGRDITSTVEAERRQQPIAADRVVDNVQPVTMQTSTPTQRLDSLASVAGQDEVLNEGSGDSSRLGGNLTRIVEAEEGQRYQSAAAINGVVDEAQPVIERTPTPSQNSTAPAAMPTLDLSNSFIDNILQTISSGCAVIKRFFFL